MTVPGRALAATAQVAMTLRVPAATTANSRSVRRVSCVGSQMRSIVVFDEGEHAGKHQTWDGLPQLMRARERSPTASVRSGDVPELTPFLSPGWLRRYGQGPYGRSR
jgi:hypothetical protein